MNFYISHPSRIFSVSLKTALNCQAADIFLPLLPLRWFFPSQPVSPPARSSSAVMYEPASRGPPAGDGAAVMDGLSAGSPGAPALLETPQEAGAARGAALPKADLGQGSQGTRLGNAATEGRAGARGTQQSPAAAPPWSGDGAFPPRVRPHSFTAWAETGREPRPRSASPLRCSRPAHGDAGAAGEPRSRRRFPTWSPGSFGQITKPPQNRGHLPSAGVGRAAVQPTPRKYYCSIDSSLPLAPEINFVFVWTVMGSNL